MQNAYRAGLNFAETYGPWAIILGASEGTGRALARQIAAHGVPCILVARRPEKLAALAAEIRQESGVDCDVAAIDLAAGDAFERIQAAAAGREIGLFTMNAGADPNGSYFLDSALPVWLDLLQRNVYIMLQCCHHFGRPMRARRRGGVLLVNSGACYGGANYMACYAATKAATLAFAEGLWGELRENGVHVLTMVMHVTDTPALRALLAEKGQALPTVMASADAVAEAALARLAHGPILNWGLRDDEAGYAILSAASRRQRVLAVAAASSAIFGTRGDC